MNPGLLAPKRPGGRIAARVPGEPGRDRRRLVRAGVPAELAAVQQRPNPVSACCALSTVPPGVVVALGLASIAGETP